jgi:formyl-CoA transferase
MSGTNASTAGLPLDGIRVIDFTQVMMGPVCTQMLADHGADVIKIERQGAGDLSRSTFEPVAGNDNPIFCSLNRNKRSVEIDLRDAKQMALVKALIADADVVTNNFRAGVMERLGLGYEDCLRLNPRIIYAVGTGFGETGPYAHKGGQTTPCQSRSTRPRWPTTPPACTWCRASCSRCCSATRPAPGRRSASRSTTRCCRCRCRRRR